MQRLENIMTCLKAIVQMEALLDQEIDRLEEEFDWDAKRCVYLQALECEAFHLDRLECKMNKSQDLIQVYRRLLYLAAEEKSVLISFLQDQKLHSKSGAQKYHSERDEKEDHTFHTGPNVLEKHDLILHRCPQQMSLLTPTASLQTALSVTAQTLPPTTIAASALAGTQSVCCDINFLCQNGRLSKMRLKSRFEIMKFRRKASKCLLLKIRPKKTELFPVRDFKLMRANKIQIC